MGLDVKVPLPKVLMSKATGYTKSNFQNYRLEHKLLQELCQKMEFVTTIVWKYATIYHVIYINIKQALNSWLVQVVTGYHIKIKFQFHCLHYDYNVSHLKLQKMHDSAYWWKFLPGVVNIRLITIPKYTPSQMPFIWLTIHDFIAWKCF